MAYIYDLTDTWNNAVTSFNGIKLNVTDTTSAVGSKLLNLQISGSSKFNVGKSGTVTATGLIESTSGGFKFPDGTIQTTASAGGGGSGTVTSVSGTGTVSGLTLTGTITTSGSLTLGGTLALTSGQVTTALGFTPYNASNPSGYITSSALSPYLTSATAATTYQPLDGDLTSIAALAGTTGIVRKTADNTYTLDTNSYLTAITSGQVTTALGFTPYNATNPSGYLSTVSLTSNVTGTLPIANGGTGQTTKAAAFNALSPITSVGDIIIGDGTNSATRLGIGANNYVLTSNGTTAVWAAGGGGGSMVYPAAGIANSTGTAWGTSYTTTGTGTVVALANSPTITGTTTLGGTAYSAPAWSTNGVGIKQPATTYIDNSTPAGNTVNTAYMNLFGTATYDTSLGSIGNEVVVTSLYGNYFKAPAVTANVQATFSYAVGIDTLHVSGAVRFDSSIGSISANAVGCQSLNVVTGPNTITGATTITGAASGLVVSVGTASFSVTPTTTGTIFMGRTTGTGNIEIGRSTASQTLSLSSAVTASGSTKTVTIGTSGAAGSTTNITVGSTTGTSTTTMNGNTATPAGAAAMTSGFFYIPAAAGAPSGTPTAITGTVPMYYDTTNNRFYIYNGAWKMVTLV